MDIDNIFNASSSSRNEPSLLDILEVRQRYLVSKLPTFFKATLIVALLGFLLTSGIQWAKNDFSLDKIGLITLSQPTLGSIITAILNLFAVIIMWIFVIWSLTFVPYIAYHAYKSSKQDNIPVGSKNFRWVQLYASTFLPMAIFSIAWSSYSNNAAEITLQIHTLIDVILIIFGSSFVAGIIYIANLYIPSKLVAIHLAILSTLLYITLFLTFGGGYNVISYSMLFGILIYLTIGSQKLEELGRRVATYDLDPKVSDKLNDIAVKNQELRSTQDEIKAKEVELKTKSALHSQNIRSDEVESNIGIAEQLSDIQRAKMEFNKLNNETLLKVFQQKAGLIHEMYGVLSKELSNRMSEEIPKEIKNLQNNAKKYSPTELQSKMSE